MLQILKAKVNLLIVPTGQLVVILSGMKNQSRRIRPINIVLLVTRLN